MYTGIVRGVERVCAITQADGYRSILISNQQHFLDDVSLGASVAVDGVCLTVTQILAEQQQVGFDIGPISLQLTTLQFLQVGSLVNIERSFKVGMENGGHQLYGHVEGMAKVAAVQSNGATLHLDIDIAAEKMRYFFHKGFIGLHGCSLTVNRVDKTCNQISVDLIPETLRLTNLNDLKPGDVLNFEIDQTTRTLVDTLHAIYAERG
jgi:riboflavin synthase